MAACTVMNIELIRLSLALIAPPHTQTLTPALTLLVHPGMSERMPFDRSLPWIV
jgi:hypothetical protein